MAPQAQKAHWKPLVSAAAGAAPWWSRVLAWVAAIVDAIAIPIAPPSCSEVLMSPEARPAWCSATPARAAIETGMKANAVPTPTMTNGPRRPRRPGLICQAADLERGLDREARYRIITQSARCGHPAHSGRICM